MRSKNRIHVCGACYDGQTEFCTGKCLRCPMACQLGPDRQCCGDDDHTYGVCACHNHPSSDLHPRGRLVLPEGAR